MGVAGSCCQPNFRQGVSEANLPVCSEKIISLWKALGMANPSDTSDVTIQPEF